MIETSFICVLIFLIQTYQVNTECPSLPSLRCCPDTVWDDEQNKCVGCPAGYLGPNCIIPCDPPGYGVGCQFTCACKRSETCHPSFGCVITTTTTTIETTTKIATTTIKTTTKITTTIETTAKTTTTTTEDDIRTTNAEVATFSANTTTKTAIM